MNKYKTPLVVFLLTSLILSACGNTSSQSSSSASNPTHSNNSTNHTETIASDSTKEKKNTTTGSGNSNGTSTKSNNSNSATTTSENNKTKKKTITPNKPKKNIIDIRCDAVINATLKMESKKKDTTVDFKSKTMTQSNQKVGFAIVPSANHQADFKDGLVKEVINNKDESHDVTLFAYQFDNNNILSLIDTSDEKVVYTTEINTDE